LGIVRAVGLARKSFVVLVVLLTGCGGSARKQSAAVEMANCLNDRGFLVQAKHRTVEGTSPSGVGFTLTLRPGKAPVVDASGNPSSAKLSPAERAALERCADKAVH
jgi:hypothetical protein